MADGIRVLAPPPAGGEAILSKEALAFLERFHRQFEPIRQSLLKRRAERQAAFASSFFTLPAYRLLE